MRFRPLFLFTILVCNTTLGLFAADAPAPFKVGEFSFARPADWQWVEVNSVMRKAQLKISDASKNQASGCVAIRRAVAKQRRAS